MKELTDEKIQYILYLLLGYANDALEDRRKDPTSEYLRGICVGYYEVLDTFKDQLEIEELDVSKYGLDFDMEETFL